MVLVPLLRIHLDTKIFEMQTWFHDLLRETAERLFDLDEVEVNRVFLAGTPPPRACDDSWRLRESCTSTFCNQEASDILPS